jgi:hypothetical protein
MSYTTLARKEAHPSAAKSSVPSALRVGQPNDTYEQEADRVAEAVMSDRTPLSWSLSKVNLGKVQRQSAPVGRVGSLPVSRDTAAEREADSAAEDITISHPFSSRNTAPVHALQRKCACGGSSGTSGECEECKKTEGRDESTKTLQRKASQPSTFSSQPFEAPPIVHEVLQSPGQPLDAATRRLVEPRFGHNFGQVRVHTDAEAAKSAIAINANAYTVGHNIIFGAGKYQPGDTAGRQLLAHELTHVVQQKTGTEKRRIQRQSGALDPDANRSLQVACVARRGGCKEEMGGGYPLEEKIANYNKVCRSSTHYTGPDVTPTPEECSNLPPEPLSTEEKILIAAFLAPPAIVIATAGAAALIAVGAEVIPVVIAGVGEGYAAGTAFYFANALAVNDIGLFTAGLVIACEGDVAGLLRAIAENPIQGVALFLEAKYLHTTIKVRNEAARRAIIPVTLLKPEQQDISSGQIKFGTGQPMLGPEVSPQEQQAPAGQVKQTPRIIEPEASAQAEQTAIVKPAPPVAGTEEGASASSKPPAQGSSIGEAVQVTPAAKLNPTETLGRSELPKPAVPTQPPVTAVQSEQTFKPPSPPPKLTTPTPEFGTSTKAQPPKSGRRIYVRPQKAQTQTGTEEKRTEGAATQPGQKAQTPKRPETGAEMEERLLDSDKPSRQATAKYFGWQGRVRGTFGSFADALREYAREFKVPIPRLNRRVLKQSTREFIASNDELQKLWDAEEKGLTDQIERVRSAKAEAAGDKVTVKNLQNQEAQLQDQLAKLNDWANAPVQSKRPDLIEVFPTEPRSEVTDITQRPFDPSHNFKTKFYVEVVKALTGWSDVVGLEFRSVQSQQPVE